MMDKYLVSPNPHIHTSTYTHTLMGDVCIALLPAIVVSVLFYGWSELLILGVSALSCVVIEWAITKFLLKREGRFCGCAALVTGLLLAMNLPPTTPWWVVVIGAIVAIGVAKMSFGGLGQNVFNPALVGRVFLLISFPAIMTDWTVPAGFLSGVDAVSGATLLGRYAEGGVEAVQGVDYLQTLFFNIGGSAGEISALALLAGWVYLLVRKVIKPWITLSIFATVAVVATIFNLCDPAQYTDALFNLLSGGMILGACFMATDYVTSPMSTLGGIIYGIGIGFIVMMIRFFGSYPEGMSFAILLMNMAVPLLNRAFHQRKYGRA
ncbi:MAG: RnfABCDGE type electron transport complex subunit D [Bacteroidales bacterium]|nr:RnfABCDGE type electron transport complex subunit D [Candidatus Cryptobacteroides aphodequi]